MRARRVKIIERMFTSIATPHELRRVDALYENNHKASAVVFMVRRIEKKWLLFLKNPTLTFNEVKALQKERQPRLVKITYRGVSSYSEL